MGRSSNLFRYAGALALAMLLFQPARAEDELKNPFAGDAAAAVEGKRLFLKTGCYACHGHEAEGAVGPDLTDDEWIYKPTDSMIFNTIAKGRSGTIMAPFGDQLNPDEIWKIVEFLRDKNRQRHLREK
jgi:cytochrome c oxidase cbb3-type subunit III